jgi:glutamine amidotransferase
MVKIAIIDFGAGNLRSITKALEHLGAEAKITKSEVAIEKSDAAVLPGVGAFYDAMREIEHLREIIRGLGDKPLLGICLGLQLLFTQSEEGGRNPGLDIIRGRVVRFGDVVKVPHMGWNTVEIVKETPLLEDVRNGSYFYFVHSYYAIPEEDIVTGTTNYGSNFPSVIEKNNVYSTQFHPEKSGNSGLKLLENFVSIVESSRS